MAGHNQNHNNFGKKEDGHPGDANLSGKKMFWVTLLNAAITVTEIIGGLISGSLSLLSDAVHNLSDTLSIAFSYFANKIARKPKDAKKTYGYKRAEILSAFINSSILLAILIWLVIEAIRRFSSPEKINGTLMIIVASIGLAANLISVFLLERDSHENLNVKSSYLHLLSDTVSSVGVIIGGITIKLWGVIWVDPLITILISVFIIREAWRMIKTTIDILMQTSAVLDYEAIINDIQKIDNVKSIHHIHSWMVNEKTICFDAHIEMENIPLCDVEKVNNRIENYLKENHGISHVTLQAELDKCCDNNTCDI